MMLGITTPDAIAFGMMVLAALAAWRGHVTGNAAKEKAIATAPMISIAGGIVDAMQFADYVKALDKLAIAMFKHAAAIEKTHNQRTTNALEEMADRIDEMLQPPQPAPEPREPQKPRRRRRRR